MPAHHRLSAVASLHPRTCLCVPRHEPAPVDPYHGFVERSRIASRIESIQEDVDEFQVRERIAARRLGAQRLKVNASTSKERTATLLDAGRWGTAALEDAEFKANPRGTPKAPPTVNATNSGSQRTCLPKPALAIASR